MKLTAHAPVTIDGRDVRPGDTFDVADAALASALVDSGQCVPANGQEAQAEADTRKRKKAAAGAPAA